MEVTTTFSATKKEIMKFVAFLLYMGVVQYSSLDDYWAMNTRESQVADNMSSKRIRFFGEQFPSATTSR